MQRWSMLLPLLAEHFNLKYRHEMKTLPVYELVSMDNGAKLTKSKPEDPSIDAAHTSRNMNYDSGSIEATGISIDVLVHALSQELDRTVIDKSGLTDNYDFTLKWTPDDRVSTDVSTNDTDAPSLFTAMQEQLGLKLISVKLPVDAVVIDHLEKPGEN